jgi:hypothetical protein
MFKNKFILPFIALILMLVSFVYFYLDLTDKKNTYKQDIQISVAAKQEAEIAVLFTNIKRDLQISYLTTLKKEFEWKTKDTVLRIAGWGFSGDTNTNLTASVLKYFSDAEFEENTLNSINNGNINTLAFQRGALVCLFDYSNLDNRISIYCGFIQ